MTEKTTFNQLLIKLEQADEGLLDFDPEEIKQVMTDTEEKVDSIVYVKNKFEKRIEEITAEINELEQIKKSLTNQLKAFKENLVWVMKERGIDKFAGIKSSIALVSKTSVEVTKEEPTAQLFLTFPDYVKRSYAWNKVELAKAFKSDPQGPLSEFCTFKEGQQIRFVSKKSL